MGKSSSKPVAPKSEAEPLVIGQVEVEKEIPDGQNENGLIIYDHTDTAQNMIQRIITLCGRVSDRFTKAIPQLEKIQDRLTKHHRDVNISRTFGVAASAAGAIMSVTPALPVGIGFMVVGGVISAGAIIGDLAVTIVNAKKAAKILKQGEQDVIELQNLIKILVKACKDFENQTGATPTDAWASVLYAIIKKGINIDACDATLDIASLAKRIASIALDITSLIRGLGTGFLDDILIAISRGMSTSFGETMSTILPGIMKVASRVFLVLGVVWDVATMIRGWIKKHPTGEQVEKAVKDIKAGVLQLQSFKQNLEAIIEALAPQALIV